MEQAKHPLAAPPCCPTLLPSPAYCCECMLVYIALGVWLFSKYNCICIAPTCHSASILRCAGSNARWDSVCRECAAGSYWGQGSWRRRAMLQLHYSVICCMMPLPLPE